ncbi:mRNA 3'-end-processing protein RNA14 [Wickerhamiella sorbophila]|uniref:mRNA 3'-end-processing protein RNA14 n=1 Tax=Wickerhamiella sorbophila TaxID=45607 RepID=A0A2T0FIE5_9ASCO|nr:mRNA 3'-end-processing protein RNA14 [Wickerhamiella sorbophila]PRT54755.1 mRNA 3'-end-processing protein RNA14 [Wickerhamiella sorbophila]
MAKESAPPKRRKLAQDVVAKQEEILREQRFSVDAFNKLLDEYRVSEQLSELWETYDRMLVVFPRSGEVWTSYAKDLMDKGELKRLEKLFSKALPIVPYVPLWSTYIAHVQQATAGNPDGAATVSQAYEYTLDKVQYDSQSGQIWAQYIDFLDGLPAASSWEKQHKMDEMRKAYRRVVFLPVSNIEQLWRAYNGFENSVARTAARKFIDERSAGYMHARSVVRELANLTKDLNTTTLPAPREFNDAEKKQLTLWRKLINFEKSNPLTTDNETVQARVLYTFRQALMSMQFFSELWFEYAAYCEQIGQTTDAVEGLQLGREVNPDSFFLTNRLAELYEEKDDYDSLEKVYRGLIASLQNRSEIDGLAVTVAFSELVRATKRMQGIERAREVSKEGRLLPYATFHIFATLAELEKQAGSTEIAARIYQVAYTKFRDAPQFVRTYLTFLFEANDTRNAEVVFEKAASDFSPAQLRSLFELYLQKQASYGDTSLLSRLEQRYCELYPDGHPVELYSRRFRLFGVDPIGEELHLEGPAPTSHELIPVPQSIVDLAQQLPPEESYDGPEIDMNRLIEIIVEYA